MTSTDKEEVETYFKFKTSRNTTMHTLSYSNISEFVGNFQGMLDGVTYKITIQNMHNLGWKAKKSSPLMFLCWITVVVFHNIVSFTIGLKYVSNVTASICGKLFR